MRYLLLSLVGCSVFYGMLVGSYFGAPAKRLLAFCIPSPGYSELQSDDVYFNFDWHFTFAVGKHYGGMECPKKLTGVGIFGLVSVLLGNGHLGGSTETRTENSGWPMD